MGRMCFLACEWTHSKRVCISMNMPEIEPQNILLCNFDSPKDETIHIYWCRYDDDWSIQSKCQQVIFRAQVGTDDLILLNMTALREGVPKSRVCFPQVEVSLLTWLAGHSGTFIYGVLPCFPGAVSPTGKRPRKASETSKANGFSRQNPVNTNPSGFTVLRHSESADSLNSLSSVYIESCGQGNYQIKGKLKTGVWYKQNEEQLYVRIVSAKGLSAAKEGGTSNPYVKVYLLPDKSKQTKRMTGIQRKTLDPTYNEILKVRCNFFFFFLFFLTESGPFCFD